MTRTINELSPDTETANDFAPVSSRPDSAPNAELPRHRWYRFKEGFSAGLVENFVREYLPDNRSGRLLDPFLGSGTTAVEGARLGHIIDGIETNPFMAFMAEVKTRDYSRAGDIEGAALRCLQLRARSSTFKIPDDTTLVERKGLDKWILNRSVARRFEQLRTAISEVEPVRVRDLLFFALLSSIEDAANAKKDGKCWRYKSNWQGLALNGQTLDEAFATQVIRFSEDITANPRLKGSANVIRGDARVMVGLKSNALQYDGVLTSPPYLNSFDYTDIYRPEMLLMQAASNATGLRKLRFKTLRSHVQVAWKSSAPLDCPLLHKKIREIDSAGLWSGRIPDMINAYFVDLDLVVEQCALRLKPGATAGFVVADSAYCGVVIPVDLILSEIFERRGFTVKKISLFRQTRGNGNHQQRSSERLREVMVVAQYRGLRRLTALNQPSAQDALGRLSGAV